MKQLTLEVESRNELGRGSTRRLRNAGGIPAVVYGESGVRHLSINERTFFHLWRQVAGRSALIEIHEEGNEPMFSIIQDVQRDPITNKFMHVDFKEIVRGREMTAEVPVHTVGTSDGVKNEGGVMEMHLSDVAIRCRPRDLPEFIEVDVAGLKVGDSIHVSSLPAVEGVTYVSSPELVVVAISGKSAEAAESDEEEAEALEA